MRLGRWVWAGLIRRPSAAVMAGIGIALAAAAGGALERTLDAVVHSVDAVDPDVDVVVGPKSGALDLYFGALHLGPCTRDVMTGQATSAADRRKLIARPSWRGVR